MDQTFVQIWHECGPVWVSKLEASKERDFGRSEAGILKIDPHTQAHHHLIIFHSIERVVVVDFKSAGLLTAFCCVAANARKHNQRKGKWHSMIASVGLDFWSLPFEDERSRTKLRNMIFSKFAGFDEGPRP